MTEGKAASADKGILGKSGLNNGKSGSLRSSRHPAAQPPKCPECGSPKNWKDGVRSTQNGEIQRFLCRSCGFRFNEHARIVDHKNPMLKGQFLRVPPKTIIHSQVCVSGQEAKNLSNQQTRQKQAAGATTTKPTDTQGKIFEYLWHLKKKGLRQSTIEHYGQKLRQLLKLGVNLSEPEQVKKCLATNEKWSECTKAILVAVYDGFTKFMGIPWEPPKYTPVRNLPFIPTEQEIDQFISACGKKLATFLQLLKETGIRCGEAPKVEWTDIDFKRRVVKITPEKGSDPRILPISEKLAGMLNNLPKQSNKVFPALLNSMKANLFITRKSIVRKLNNPRLLKISFHTLTHWKGTTEYHKTKDIIHVQRVLRHRDIKSTMIYITLENALFQNTNEEFYVKTAKTVEEACKLVEVGFEYVTIIDGVQVFRKRK